MKEIEDGQVHVSHSLSRSCGDVQVELTLLDTQARLTVDQARQVGLLLLRHAEQAEQDAALWQYMIENNVPGETREKVIRQVGTLRQKFQEEAARRRMDLLIAEYREWPDPERN